MGGPAASIILRSPLTEEAKNEIRADLQELSSHVEGDDFWVQRRPFGLAFGPEYDGELEQYVADGVSEIVGWVPKDIICIVAFRNDDLAHRLLGEICLHFVRKTNGLLDFGGAITPPIQGEVEQLLEGLVHGRGTGNDWQDWKSHFDSMSRGMRGRLYNVPYTTSLGAEWCYHICDAKFLEAWLQHPHFHMVK